MPHAAQTDRNSLYRLPIYWDKLFIMELGMHPIFYYLFKKSGKIPPIKKMRRSG